MIMQEHVKKRNVMTTFLWSYQPSCHYCNLYAAILTGWSTKILTNFRSEKKDRTKIFDAFYKYFENNTILNKTGLQPVSRHAEQILVFSKKFKILRKRDHY